MKLKRHMFYCRSGLGHTSHHPRAPTRAHTSHLVHLPDELVDVGLPVTKVTALHVVLELARPPPASGVGELEGPQEVRGLRKSV